MENLVIYYLHKQYPFFSGSPHRARDRAGVLHLPGHRAHHRQPQDGVRLLYHVHGLGCPTLRPFRLLQDQASLHRYVSNFLVHSVKLL